MILIMNLMKGLDFDMKNNCTLENDFGVTFYCGVCGGKLNQIEAINTFDKKKGCKYCKSAEGYIEIGGSPLPSIPPIQPNLQNMTFDEIMDFMVKGH
jgi:hypothetical protein